MNKITLMVLLACMFEVFLINACTDKDINEKPYNSLNADLVIKGSDSEYELVKHLLEEYKTVSPKTTFSIEGGGSSKGIEALIEGSVNIATSSRELSQEEFNYASEERLQLSPFIFALDAVAFIAHSQVGVDSLSPELLKKIYQGEITNWKELGGADLLIILIGRDAFSGTNGYIKNRLHIDEWSKNIIALEHNVDIYNKVKSTKGGIGYVSLGTVVSTTGKPVPDVWAVNIYSDYSGSVSPYEISKVQNGEYFFSRPLYMYISNTKDNKIKSFFDFVVTEQEQNSLWEKGYFPITESHKKINSKNLIQ